MLLAGLAVLVASPPSWLPALGPGAGGAFASPRRRRPRRRRRHPSSPASPSFPPPPPAEGPCGPAAEAPAATRRLRPPRRPHACLPLGVVPAPCPAGAHAGAARRRPDRLAEAQALARHREVGPRPRGEGGLGRRPRAEYEKALAVDPHVAFGVEGKERAGARAALATGSPSTWLNPHRPPPEAVAREAESLLDRARDVEAQGPRHRTQVAALEKALGEARASVAVVLESDGLTEIVPEPRGPAGAPTRRTVELRPGDLHRRGVAPGLPGRAAPVHGDPRGGAGPRRRPLRGGPLTVCVEEGGRSRRLGPGEFPVPLGGPGSALP